jgi:hypothetical protein
MEVPTQTISPEEVSQTISPEEVEKMVKAWCEQKYFETGKVPTTSAIIEAWDTSFPVVHNLLPQMKPYLQTLKQSTDHMEPKAFILAQMLLSTGDRRSLRTKLKSIGVTMVEYERIRRNPKFLEYMRKESQRRFGETDVTADLELIKNVEDGDLNAIKYYNELIGRAPSQESVNVAKVLATVM